jgi:hypothetical protein
MSCSMRKDTQMDMTKPMVAFRKSGTHLIALYHVICKRHCNEHNFDMWKRAFYYENNLSDWRGAYSTHKGVNHLWQFALQNVLSESRFRIYAKAPKTNSVLYNYLLHVSTNIVIVRRNYYKNTHWEAEYRKRRPEILILPLLYIFLIGLPDDLIGRNL